MNEGLWYDVKDNEGNKVIHFFSQLMVRDGDAYVRSINIPDEKKDGIKLLIKQSEQKNENN